MRPASRPAPGFSADRPVHDAALDPVNTGNATLPPVRATAPGTRRQSQVAAEVPSEDKKKIAVVVRKTAS